MNLAIRLQHVSKHFARQIALENVSFDVPQGVVFALLGENGAGKTTAIRLMLGLAEPDAGEIEVLGLNSRRQGREVRQRVGYVPERPTLYEWMTVDEIGWFTAGFYPKGFQDRFRQLARDFHLPADRKIKSLSKGMRSKVALSLAMAHEPELLVLDEPTSGLDTLVRREFLESMVDLAAAGRTVFLSSHQIGEVERVADYVAIVRAGRLLVVERLDELKRQFHELIVTLADVDSTILAYEQLSLAPANIVHHERRGRQWQLTLRGVINGQVDRMRSLPFVTGVEVRQPALEEIFVAFLRSTSQPAPAAEAAS